MSWSVAEAKAHLSEVLRRARQGEPQIVGAQDPCVVISKKDYEAKFSPEHLGRALLKIGAGLKADIDLPARGPGRPVQLPED